MNMKSTCTARPHDGIAEWSVILGGLAPIPEQKKEMGELHMWDETRDVLSYSWPSSLQLWAWFIYSTETMQKGLLTWKSNILVFAMSWE